MREQIKNIKISIRVLRLNSFLITMFLINAAAFFVGDIFDGSSANFITNLLQILIGALSSVIVYSVFSQFYHFLMSAPYKIGNAGNQIFSIFELSTIINFTFTTIISAINRNGIMAIFQIMDLFLVLIMGYITIFLLSTTEMKINERSHMVWCWLIDYVGAILIMVLQKSYLSSFENHPALLKPLIGVTAVAGITALILRKTLRKASTEKIRGMKIVKRKTKRTA